MAIPRCCICPNENDLFPLSKIDSSQVSFKDKLDKIVPEIPWNNTMAICPHCVDKLQILQDFRAKCLMVNVEEQELTTENVENTFNNSSMNDSLSEEDRSSETEHCTRYRSPNLKYRIMKKVKHRDPQYNGSYDLCNAQNQVTNHDMKLEIEQNKCDDEFNTDEPYEAHENVFICFHCNKSFKTKGVLAKHIKVSHEIKKFVCSDCGLNFKNGTLLKKHLQTHSIDEKKNKLYQCSKCEKSYKVEKVMKVHFETCDGIKRHSKINFTKDFTKNKCEKCDRFYTTEKILRAHIKNCKGVKIDVSNCYICNIPLNCDKDKSEHVLQQHGINLDIETTCQYCYKECLVLSELQLHLEENHGKKIVKRDKRKNYMDRSYSCEVCSKIFGYVKEVIEHCIKDHEMDSKLVKPFLCDKCDTRFTSSANLIQHKQYHEGNRSHICSFCGKSYITKSDLTVHEYTHLNKRNYKCEFCDRAFNTNKNLRSHILVVHTNASLWKYHCDECDKRFPLKSGYDQHIRRHAGDKRFQCLICQKSFVSSSELRKHMTFHSNVRAFKCSHCDKEYKDRRVYEIHLTKVHGIGNAKIPVRVKKHACHICPSKFFDKQKLARHLCTHTGIKPFPCTICEKRFTDKSYLKNHYKVAHDIINMDEMKISDAV